MDSRFHTTPQENDDPFEAIFALNMGDFVTEHLISGDLLSKISQTAANPDRVKKQLEELVDIYSLNNTLSLLGFHSSEGFVIYDSMAMSLADMLQVDACHIFQTMTKDGEPHFLSLTGTSVEGVPDRRWNIGYELFDQSQWVVEAYNDGFPMVYPDIDSSSTGWKAISELHQDKTRSVIIIPLMEGDRRIGMLLFETTEPCDFPQEFIDLAESTGNVFVTSLTLQKRVEQARKLMADSAPDVGEMLSLRAELTELIADLGRAQQFFVESLAYAIDARNDFTMGHSQGVARLAKSLAERMALSEKTVDLVYYAGLLGSVGKIHVPQEILRKEGSLSAQELDALRNSPNMGVGLLMKLNFLSEVIPYVEYQKERWDGQDSPHGLSGRSIPLGSRILAVADAFYALTQERPYRDAPLSNDEALKIIQGEAGSKWDPDVVASLASVASDLA